MQLEELLGAELFAQVQTKINEHNEKEPDRQKHVRFVDLSEGGYVGKGKYDALETEKNSLTEQVQTLNETIATLKKDNKDNEALQNAVNDLQEKLTQQQKTMTDRMRTLTLEREMQKLGVVDPDYLIYKAGGVEKFDFSEDGEPKHLETVLQPLREDKTLQHLFRPKSGGYQPQSGSGPLGGGNPFAKESYNLTKQGELLKKDPVRARELANAAGVQLE